MSEHAEYQPLDWDSPIENDGDERTLLPNGTECKFEVIGIEKMFDDRNSCPLALLRMECEALDGAGKTRIMERLSLSTQFEWKLCAFFRAIGQRVHGEKLIPDWAIEGATGCCVLEQYEDKKGKTWNRVKKYLDPDDVLTDAQMGQNKAKTPELSFG